MRIGILETGELDGPVREKHGAYPAMFEALLAGRGFAFRTWSVVNGVMPDGVGDADGWLVTGSKHGAYEDHAWIPPLEGFIRAIRDAGRPLVGICFGHQIIAQALGGRVEKADAGWGLGGQVYDGPDGPLRLRGFHQDQVVAAPEGATVTAGSAFCPAAALAYGDWARSWQGHPEFGQDLFRDLAESKIGAVFEADFVARAVATAEGATDGPRIGREIGDFFLSHAPVSG